MTKRSRQEEPKAQESQPTSPQAGLREDLAGLALEIAKKYGPTLAKLLFDRLLSVGGRFPSGPQMAESVPGQDLNPVAEAVLRSAAKPPGQSFAAPEPPESPPEPEETLIPDPRTAGDTGPNKSEDEE